VAEIPVGVQATKTVASRTATRRVVEIACNGLVRGRGAVEETADLRRAGKLSILYDST
jgi:hypothetical protein